MAKSLISAKLEKTFFNLLLLEYFLILLFLVNIHTDIRGMQSFTFNVLIESLHLSKKSEAFRFIFVQFGIQ